MKILEPGNGAKGWSKEYICTGKGNGGGGCGAKLLVEEGDLFRTSSSCRDETNYFTTFECAQCSVWTDVNDVPSQISNGLKHRSPSSRRGANNS